MVPTVRGDVRGAVRLTVVAKLLLASVIGVTTVVAVRSLSGRGPHLFPEAKIQASAQVQQVDLPVLSDRDAASASNAGASAALPGTRPGCANLPEVRMELWAWNSQMGLLFANGGRQATEGSAMCRNGVNLELVRQDDPSKMREDLVAFARADASGNSNPSDGVQFVAIMGDGSAAFLEELNTVLARLGPEVRAKVVGSAGYSWGEDKFMGPAAWKRDPQASRGGVVAGVLRDGDWNIAQKWLGENRLCNNPDEHTYDPDCLNWVGTPGYVEAAQAYVAGYCETRPVVRHGVKTGADKKVCVDGVVTWTPGDVTVAKQRGGLVSIVSTREYRGQMPQVVIGLGPWMEAHRATVEGLLAAMFEGGEAVKASDAALDHAAAIAVQVYGEQDAAYWAKYFHGVTEPDRTGLPVELGGSRVNSLADDLFLFGLSKDSTDLFAKTYTVFGNLVKAQYPELLPSIAPASAVVDTRYLQAVAARTGKVSAPDLPRFSSRRIDQVVSRGDWRIEFRPGKAEFSPEAERTLEALFDELVIAGGTAVEVHGHTDNTGDARANDRLSEARAFAVKAWLEKRSPANFPAGRVRVFAHGQENPVAPNSSAEGRALNRRVQIVLGTSST